MTRLERALARLAGAERLLVASDFDGTLSPIADLPAAARPDAVACGALQAIGKLPDTHAAILSGRARAVLRDLLGRQAEGVLLVGSHGAEIEGEAVLSPARLRLRDQLAADLEAIAARQPGAVVERKPVGAAFHYRGVAVDARAAVVREVVRGPGRRAGVRLREGRKVVELVVVPADKGRALERLRRSLNITATLFLGDDRTDEDAFALLDPLDLGVKVGRGATRAAVRIGAQNEVGPLLRRLHELRSERILGQRSGP
ncbi:MAG: trehalose-phosphatase [Gemmatimonadota bacterium]